MAVHYKLKSIQSIRNENLHVLMQINDKITCVLYSVAVGGIVKDVTEDVSDPVRIPVSTSPANVQRIATTRPLNVLGVISPYL